MESFTASALPSKYATAFSFPLCYATSDANSDSEASTYSSTSATSRTSVERSVVGSKNSAFADTFHDSGVVSETRFLKCMTTPSLLPPPRFGKLVATEGLNDDTLAPVLAKVKAMNHLNLHESGNNDDVGGDIVRSATAPPARTVFAQSSCTSAISSFSSESLPVLLTSSQSQESTDYESSQLDSDLADLDRLPWMEQASDGTNSSNFCSFPRSSCEEVLSSTSSNSVPVMTQSRIEDTGEDNLVNNSELTVSLESVLTVVPLPQAPDQCITSERSQLEGLHSSSPQPYADKPRHSTSSFGDVSIQSWDSHLESDPVIDDIVENVIHDLTLYDGDTKTWGGILHPDSSHVNERKASPASMSSYASSRRLEWDNGADIGYTKVPDQTNYDGQSVGVLNVGSMFPQSELEGRDNKESTSYESLQKDKRCSTCPEHLTNSVAPVVSSSCSVTVQTDMSCMKDAQVQAQPALPKPSLQARVDDIMTPSLPLHVTESVRNLSNGNPCSTTLSCYASLLNDDTRLLSFNSERSCPKAVNLATPIIIRSTEAHVKQCKPDDNGKVLKDCARRVALCYSQQFSRDFENYISKKGHATDTLNSDTGDTTRAVSSVSSIGRVNDTSSGPSADGGRGHVVPLTPVKSVSSNHLKMQFPVRLGGLTSGTDSPADVPRYSSEINKRRLDYWLSCGFPYVPSVMPLKVEAQNDTLPKVNDSSHQSRMIQAPSVGSSTFPQLLKISSSCVEAPKTHLHERLPLEHVPTRKRYVTRCQTSRVAEKELLCTSNGSRSISAVTKETPGEGILQACKPAASFRGLRRLPQEGTLKAGCAAPIPFVFRERSSRCTAKPRKGRAHRLAPSGVSDGSEAVETSREWPFFAKPPDSEDGSSNGGTEVNTLSALPDTSSSASSSISGGGRCHLRRVARRELEKLRMLVDKQRHSYLKRLQKEVNRLQKLESLFLNERDKQNAALPHTAPVTRSLQSCTIPSLSPRTHSSRNHVSARTSNSYVKTSSQPERYFVTIAASPKKAKRHQQSSKATGISWVVPLLPSAGSQRENTSAEVAERLHQLKSFSLQAAFAENCKHIIRHSQDRLSRVTALAERRSRLRAVFPATSQEPKSTMLRRSGSQKTQAGVTHPRALYTHREMRQQTEKVYKKLPEVVQMKEKLGREQQYRMNRQTVQAYNKAIQEHALRGRVSFAIDRPCINL